MMKFGGAAKALKPAMDDFNAAGPGSATIKTTAGALVASRAGNAEMKNVLERLIKSNEAQTKGLREVAMKDTVLKLNEREFGRATKNTINREMRLDRSAIG